MDPKEALIKPGSQMGRTSIVSLGTAVPEAGVAQDHMADFLAEVARAQPEARPGIDRAIRRMAGRTGIETRHSVLSDFRAPGPSAFEFFPRNWALEPFPSTRQRLAVYESQVVPLAEQAARRALDQGRVAPSDVSHVVLTSCTGFFAPGPDVLLSDRLGLRPDTHRTLIGFMGCYAGFNGLRTAHEIVQSDPGAVVLVVAVELCTLHVQRTPDLETAVSNLIFADGAGAAVVARQPRGRAFVRRARSELAPGTRDEMAWHIGDHGFVMHLAPTVPEHLQANAAAFARRLGAEPSGRFAVHPGGRRVLESVSEAVRDELQESFQVLRDYGNMSSASIFFVLDRVLRADDDRPVAALGFGPGLSMEGLLLER